jgi:thiamine-phosphate pyrophosphorylase
VSMGTRLPRLYAIVDTSLIPPGLPALASFAGELVAAGATLLQYRNKLAGTSAMLSEARELRRVAPKARLFMNDRADLCVAARFDGVHLGQDDLSAPAARKVVGSGLWVGISTHNTAQVREADSGPADYIAVGPVFATGSKRNPDPVIGLEGVKEARRATRKPLVAIGGIKRENCRDVIAAGADSVAVISDLVESPGKSVEDFLRILE